MQQFLLKHSSPERAISTFIYFGKPIESMHFQVIPIEYNVANGKMIASGAVEAEIYQLYIS